MDRVTMGHRAVSATTERLDYVGVQARMQKHLIEHISASLLREQELVPQGDFFRGVSCFAAIMLSQLILPINDRGTRKQIASGILATVEETLNAIGVDGPRDDVGSP